MIQMVESREQSDFTLHAATYDRIAGNSPEQSSGQHYRKANEYTLLVTLSAIIKANEQMIQGSESREQADFSRKASTESRKFVDISEKSSSG
jgi:hypothetical protein